MKKFILSLALAISIGIHAQNIDSLFYSDIDTTGLAKEIAIEEANYDWRDTLNDGNLPCDTIPVPVKKKYKNISDLAHDLTAPFNTDEDKVRSIFMWMTANIVYDYILLEKKNRHIGKGFDYTKKDSEEEMIQKFEALYYEYATKVMKEKRGICEGYATLFYEICKASNIPCQVVAGYANKDPKKVAMRTNKKSFASNHAWNKVYLYDQWFYIDVTWASCGKYDGRRHECDSYTPYYYLVPESKLYDTHAINEKQTKKRNDIVGNFH